MNPLDALAYLGVGVLAGLAIIFLWVVVGATRISLARHANNDGGRE